MTQYVMFLANLFSRICSARGQFVIVVANQCKHVALLGKFTDFQGLVFIPTTKINFFGT